MPGDNFTVTTRIASHAPPTRKRVPLMPKPKGLPSAGSSTSAAQLAARPEIADTPKNTETTNRPAIGSDRIKHGIWLHPSRAGRVGPRSGCTDLRRVVPLGSEGSVNVRPLRRGSLHVARYPRRSAWHGGSTTHDSARQKRTRSCCFQIATANRQHEPRFVHFVRENWSGRPDLNRRPPVPQTGALPDCATPRRAPQSSTGPA